MGGSRSCGCAFAACLAKKTIFILYLYVYVVNSRGGWLVSLFVMYRRSSSNDYGLSYI